MSDIGPSWSSCSIMFSLQSDLNPLPSNKILDWSKLKAFADDNINVNHKLKFDLERGENIVGKGENASYDNFLFFLKCLRKAIFSGSFNPFPHNDTFWRPWETSLLKTLWEKEKLLVTSNFSFTHSVFHPFRELSGIFIKFKIVVCRLFQFEPVQNLSSGNGLKSGLLFKGFFIYSVLSGLWQGKI